MTLTLGPGQGDVESLDSKSVQQNDFEQVSRSGKPGALRRVFFYLFELGALCAFARVVFLP
jgi:hypothetical protein